MVTASHNPPQDNGYKVYLGDGSQIVPPADSEIAARIAAVGPLADVPRGDGRHACSARTSSTATSTRVAGLAERRPARPDASSTRRCTASAARRSRRCSRPAGFAAPHVVEQQEQPDPDFPTVAFPNPEEPGAMDLAMALAAEARAPTSWWPTTPTPTAAPSRCPTPHGWRMLRGDEVGALLGPPPAAARARRASTPTSIVSSQPARQDGRRRRAAARRDADRLQVDRPGRGARVRLRGGARLLRATPSTSGTRTASRRCCWSASSPRRPRPRAARCTDLLDDIAREHGLHATDQLSVRVDDLAADRRRRWTGCAAAPPTTLGGLAVEQVEDLVRGIGRRCRRPTGCATASPSGARVIVRPSGHRAQDQVLPRGRRARWRPGRRGGVDAARISAAGRLDAIKADLRGTAFGG